MTARSSLGLLCAALLLTTAGCVAESSKTDTLVIQQQAKTPTARTPAAKAPAGDTVDTIVPGTGTLVLRNPNFANVTVEARVGPNADCSQNPIFGTRQLQRNASWTISANQDICWRRDANPDAPNGQWSSWNRQAITAGASHEASL